MPVAIVTHPHVRAKVRGAIDARIGRAQAARAATDSPAEYRRFTAVVDELIDVRNELLGVPPGRPVVPPVPPPLGELP